MIIDTCAAVYNSLTLLCTLHCVLSTLCIGECTAGHTAACIGECTARCTAACTARCTAACTAACTHHFEMLCAGVGGWEYIHSWRIGGRLKDRSVTLQTPVSSRSACRVESRVQSAECREQSAECRVQSAESSEQSAECREQRAESREQRVESREQRVERCRGAECRKQRAEKVGIIRVAMQLAPPIMRLTGTAPPWALPVREMIGGASCIATHCSTRLSASTTFSLCSVWIAAESIIATRSTPGHPQLRDRERLRHNVRWTQ